MNLTEIAHHYGTPAYVYDLEALRAAHADLRHALPEPSIIYYSLKANPHPLLVAALSGRGCHAEVTSEGEVEAAREAGIDPAKILMTGPGKNERTISHALDSGVRRFSVDSPQDISRLGEVAARYGEPVDCLLRVNADEGVGGMGLAMTGTASQFGADASWVTDAPNRFFGNGYTRLNGLHLYMGSNLDGEDLLLRQFEVAVDLASRMMSVFGSLTEIDLGGGFGAPYAKDGERERYPHMADRLAELFDAKLPGWRNGAPQISFESGRYLVGDCGTLVCEVLDQKTSKGKTFTILDSGINHLGGMAGLRRLPPIVPSVHPLDEDPDADHTAEDAATPGDAVTDDVVDGVGDETVQTDLVGPLCTPLDSFSRSANLAPMSVGQYVSIPNVGAYGLTASLLAFLGHPAPVEVFSDGAEVVGATRLQFDRFPASASIDEVVNH